MARRSLKPQLNQIRAWVRQGRTDAWIAHQLEISAAELREFREEHGLARDEGDTGSEEVDLRDEIEAEVEAATVEEAAKEPTEEEAEAEEEEAEEPEEEAEELQVAPAEGPEAEAGEGEGPAAAAARPRRRRRRGRRGGRARRKELEGTFDHGERDGYGLWLDPAIKDNPIYVEHWAGKREITLRVEPDQILIRRAGEPEPDDSDE